MLTHRININKLTAIDAWSSLRAACYRDSGKMSTRIDENEEMEDLFEITKSYCLSTKGCKGVDIFFYVLIYLFTQYNRIG